MKTNTSACTPPPLRPRPCPSDRPGRWSRIATRRCSTNLQAATLVAPSLIEHGVALTVQELVPEFAGATRGYREGPAAIGHFFSIETGEIRHTAPIRLTPEQLFVNWLFAADTRFGKTVYAMRVVREMLAHHACRVLVGDFAAGWRDLLHLADLQDTRVEFGSLYPNSPRPLHFNLLRVGPHVDAESTLNALVDLITNAGRMGERQYGFLRETLRNLYLRLGVLTEDDEVLQHERWGWVQDDERELINRLRAQRGEDPLPSDPVALLDLHPDPLIARAERQALASQRSRLADHARLGQRPADAARQVQPPAHQLRFDPGHPQPPQAPGRRRSGAHVRRRRRLAADRRTGLAERPRRARSGRGRASQRLRQSGAHLA